MVGVILTFDITKTTQPDGSASASVGNVHAVPMVMHYDSNYTNARAYLYRDYTEELALLMVCAHAFPVSVRNISHSF